MPELENYNPLEKRNIGESVVTAVLEKQVEPLRAIQPFDGVGIYALYYVGDFPAYANLAGVNAEGRFLHPIYVGKAVPSGARKGLAVEIGQQLYKRLREHAESIEQTGSLKLEDFFCRHLNVDDIWIPLGESLLIEKFKPVWNVLLDGFGNHDPGSGRYEGKMTKWDVLHPGRSWAEKCKPREESPESLAKAVAAYLEIIK